MKIKIKKAEVLLALFLLLGLALPSIAMAHTEEEPYTTDLIAGGGNPKSAIDVGDILIWNDGENLYVKYVLAEGWVMSESHLAVGSFEDIPQTKTGNPIPGKFEYGRIYDPPVTEDTYVIPLAELGAELCIAAHAVVWDTSSLTTMEVVSGTDGDVVYGPLYEYAPLGDELWGESKPAVATWVHSSWPSIDGATWISTAYYVEDAVDDSWRWFHREEDVPGYPVSGSAVFATSDNAEEFYFNGVLVGFDGEVQGPFVDNHEWNTVITYSIDPECGVNTLDFIVRNYYLASGTVTSNPTGLIYKASINYYAHGETAWGNGTAFPGKNWATYITYNVQTTPQRWPAEGVAYIGYEDLPTAGSSDFDYNDFGMYMSVTEWTYPDGAVDEIDMVFEGKIHLAGYSHSISINWTSDSVTGNYTVEYYEAGSETPYDTVEKDFEGSVNIVIFENTGSYVGDTSCVGDVTKVYIYLDEPAMPVMEPPYDPYIYVKNTGATYHVGDLYDAPISMPAGSKRLPWILVVPVTWIPPAEAVNIWVAYQYFDDYYVDGGFYIDSEWHTDWYNYPTGPLAWSP